MHSKRKIASSLSPDSQAFKSLIRIKKGTPKHTRGGTLQLLSLSPSSLILKHFMRSARQTTRHQHLFPIDSLVHNLSNRSALSAKEVTRMAGSEQLMANYYIFSKRRTSHKQQTIETHLVQAIRNRPEYEYESKPLPHFQTRIYPLIRHYAQKRKRALRKMQLQGVSSLSQHLPTTCKEPPTAASCKDRDETHWRNREAEQCGRLDTSQSMELKALADCIRVMFQRQWAGRNNLGVSTQSWLDNQRNEGQPQPFVDDCSSICPSDAFTPCRDHQDIEENYGLGEIRRNFQKQRASQLQRPQQRLAHKRNPTDLAPRHNFFESCSALEQPVRSAIGSYQHIPLEERQNFQLCFDKSKGKGREEKLRQALKENIKDLRRMQGKCLRPSKSKSKKKGELTPLSKRKAH